MKIEAIVYYILQILLLLLETYIAYLLLKYLRRKPMGMQTILDKVVKDTILFLLFDQILRVFIMALIVEFARPLSDDILFIITTLLRFFSGLRFLNTFTIIMVRYILVFYHTYLNIFDEKVTRRIIRCLVCILSAMIAAGDSGNNHMLMYYFLKGEETLLTKKSPKFMIMSISIIVIVLIITQYQIEKFKKSVDSQSFDNLEAIQDNQVAGKCINQTHFNPHRIEIITGLLLVFINAFFQLSLYLWHGNLYIDSLRGTLLLQISIIILALMFIFKNEKIYSFMKHHTKSQLFCKSSDDIYSHNSDDSKVDAIYKPQYEVHDNFNFDGTEEEIDSQHVNQLSQLEFSSVIFVKECNPEKDSAPQNIDQDSASSNDGEKNWNNNHDPKPGCSFWVDNS